MIVLDASVVIAFLDSSDAHNQAAVTLLIQHPGKYLIHPLTAGEVLVGPARQGIEQQTWSDLLSVGVELADLGPGEPIALARLRATWKRKMPDTCVLATAQHYKIALATFDEQLAATARSAGIGAIGA